MSGYDDWLSREPDPGRDAIGPQPMRPPTPKCQCGAYVVMSPRGWWMPFCADCAGKTRQTNASDC